MTSGGCLEAWLIKSCTAVYWKCHTSKRPPDILRMSFTRPSTALAVIEGLGTRLADGLAYTTNNTLKVHMWLVGSMKSSWAKPNLPDLLLGFVYAIVKNWSLIQVVFIQVQAVTNHRFCHGLDLLSCPRFLKNMKYM